MQFLAKFTVLTVLRYSALFKGGFGVTAIMTGDAVVKLVNSNLLEDTTDKECLMTTSMTTSMTTTSTMTTTSSPEPIGPHPVDVAITIALMAGIIQVWSS